MQNTRGTFDSLLLAQILEYERDKIHWSRQAASKEESHNQVHSTTSVAGSVPSVVHTGSGRAGEGHAAISPMEEAFHSSKLLI